MINAATEHARNLNVSSLHWLFTKEQDTALFKNQPEYMLRLGCQFHWHNQGYRDFDEFLATFTSSKRKKARRDRRRVAEAGIRFRRLRGPQLDAETWNYHLSAIAEASGRWLGAVVGDDVLVIEIGEAGLSEPRRLGRLDNKFAWVDVDPLGRFVVTAEKNGSVKLWDVHGDTPPTVLRGPPGTTSLL